MKLLLRSDVEGVGKRGDIVDVADGYARNYLVPKGFAIKATPGRRSPGRAPCGARATLKDAADRAAAEEIAKTLVPAVITVTVPGQRRGQALRLGHHDRDRSRPSQAQTGVELDRKVTSQLDEPIKTTGTHHVPAKLHSDVQFQITVEVSAS